MIGEVEAVFDAGAETRTQDRRRVKRMLNVWARSARGRFPSWSDLQRTDLGDDWEWVFVVDLEQSVGFPYFVYLGDRLARLSNVYLSGANDWTMTFLDKASFQIESAIALEGPHVCEDDLILCDGRRVQFRAMTAPLADDGRTISHIFGAVSGRLAPGEQRRAR